MKPVIPHEHGGWAMVTVPVVVGTWAGGATAWHILLFLAWLFMYLAAYPVLQSLKAKADRPRLFRWAAIYGAAGALLGAPLLVHEPRLLWLGPLIALLLAVNVWHAKRKKERALLNDLCAVAAFSLAGAGAFMLGMTESSRLAGMVALLAFAYFVGSIFFVKSVFRLRGNSAWLIVGLVFHGLLLALPAAVGYPWVGAAFLFSLYRMARYGGRTIRPMKAGVLEIINSVQFALLAGSLLAAAS
ncbi:YwiC-like family protein [Paenibacillus turpanensis]|uniref:YwiC-like family protein n=1 Tax=Paenibacillus turpanensis TaxID=2689078 RepID=UPI00140BCF9A|nr:YwiC-like family protein [Paenibacillus turpanensis]